MNTKGLLESWMLRVSCKVNYARDPKYSLFHKQIKMFFFLYKNWFYLGIKTVLHLKYNRFNDFVGVLNGKAEQPLGCGSLSITTAVSHLANEFNVRSVLHEQVILAAVNQNRVIHEAMNGCKNLQIH